MISARLKARLAKLEQTSSEQSCYDADKVIRCAIARLSERDREVIKTLSLPQVNVAYPEIMARFEQALPAAHRDANAPFVMSADQLFI